MPRGGARPGAGRKPKDPEKSAAKKAAQVAAREPHAYTAPDGSKTADAPKDWPFGTSGEVGQPQAGSEPKKSFTSPLEYWHHVLQDPDASPSAKHAAAFSMAPYVHPKIAPMAKKEAAKEQSKKAATGRFAAGAAPLKLIKKA